MKIYFKVLKIFAVHLLRALSPGWVSWLDWLPTSQSRSELVSVPESGELTNHR